MRVGLVSEYTVCLFFLQTAPPGLLYDLFFGNDDSGLIPHAGQSRLLLLAAHSSVGG